MQRSLFLAQLIGPFAAVVGLALLVNDAFYRAMAQEFVGSHALVFLAGLLALPTGLAIVLTHNVWTRDWRVIVTLLGWATFLGGIVRVIAPEQAIGAARALLAHPGAMKIAAAVWLAVGVLLCFFGYLRNQQPLLGAKR